MMDTIRVINVINLIGKWTFERQSVVTSVAIVQRWWTFLMQMVWLELFNSLGHCVVN